MKSRVRIVEFVLAIMVTPCVGCSIAPYRITRTDAWWIGDKNASVQSSESPTDHASADENAVVVVGRLSDQDDEESFAGDWTNGLTPLGESTTLTGNPTLIGGTRLGSAQITATEYALQLREENARMKQAGHKLLSDNRRMRADLAKKNNLLVRVENALLAAREELTAADQANRTLKNRVNVLENEHQQQKMATDRMLATIRGELDDALMREITVNQE